MRMKRFFYLLLIPLCMGMTSCSSDDDDGQDPNKGADNTTDLVVTGSYGSFSIDSNDNIEVEITGYLNLPNEVKATLGLGVQAFGVEISQSSSFPASSSLQFRGNRLEDERKFVVTVSGLDEKTQYYYRSYFGAADTYIYGSTGSFTTVSLEEAVGKIETPNPTTVEERTAFIGLVDKFQIAYDTNQASLTVENISKGKVKLSNGYLEDLETGTTYYYCAVRKIANLVVLGEVKSFTTKGFNTQELAKYVSAKISYDEKTCMWSATITSSLEKQYPNNDIKYGISSYFTTTYTGTEGSKIEVWSVGGTGGSAYVKADGTVSMISAPQYLAISEDGEYVDPTFDWRSGITDLGDVMLCIHELQGLEDRREKFGYLTSGEEARYEELKDILQSLYSLHDTVHSWLGIVVVIDNVQYLVKKQEGKLRLPWDVVISDPTTGEDQDKDK